MFKTKPTDTVELSGTLVKLDGLYQSYESVLEQVKDQLCSIDINDDHINRIVARLRGDRNFISNVSKAAVDNLTDTLRDASCEEIAEDKRLGNLMKVMSHHVVFELQEHFDQILSHHLSQYLTDEKLAEVLESTVRENPRIKRAYASLDTLESLLKYIAEGLKTED